MSSLLTRALGEAVIRIWSNLSQDVQNHLFHVIPRLLVDEMGPRADRSYIVDGGKEAVREGAA